MNLKNVAMALLIGSTALLAACDVPIYKQNQELRRELFFKCLDKLPKGPEKTVYNDWDEVVAECGIHAQNLALTCKKNCS